MIIAIKLQPMKVPRVSIIYAMCSIALFLFIGQPQQAIAIEVTDAKISVEKGTLYLDATSEINLLANVKAALDKGVDLFFVTNMKIVKPRKFLPDKAIMNIEIIRRLSFHALTKKYVVGDLAFKKTTSFTSLESALMTLGTYDQIPLINKAVINPSTDKKALIRIKLMSRELPIPLRLKKIFSKSWRLSSGWYVFPLE